MYKCLRLSRMVINLKLTLDKQHQFLALCCGVAKAEVLDDVAGGGRGRREGEKGPRRLLAR